MPDLAVFKSSTGILKDFVQKINFRVQAKKTMKDMNKKKKGIKFSLK